ncbi:hypothetical protein [Hansschlegelia plantiphila]|uniref:Uncharacterized protein n=1 Tax=Hansschlegelia plantiphila TaxID=374655 RepID=A0A9W6J3Q4_9HYPH|nr:hypothetical protein [Hansschlegelia plantiphila]GLK69198.1 hypothetical protein GCM10008179_28360 [Hansschlegelia plantiphila]
MSGTVWSKFYWSDWESDPALRLCSLAAQGLWMRMLCIASAHDPIGYVAVAGRGLDETALARMTGCSESEAAALLGELDQNGVFSRDRQGRIYSRRMTTDAKKAATARKNGKNGGNPSLRKQSENSASDKGSDKSPLKPQEPEARDQKKEILPSVEQRNPKAGRGCRLPDGWKPSDPGLQFARGLGASDREIERELSTMTDWALQASGDKGVKRDWEAFWRNWIRKAAEAGRFTGTAAPQLRAIAAAVPGPVSNEQWLKRLQWAREREDWRAEWGPMPGQPGSLVPDNLMTEAFRMTFEAMLASDRRKAG